MQASHTFTDGTDLYSWKEFRVDRVPVQGVQSLSESREV